MNSEWERIQQILASSIGSMGAMLREIDPNHDISGMELDRAMAEFESMSDLESFALFERVRAAMEAHAIANVEFEEWRKRKGKLAIHIQSLLKVQEPPK